MLIDGAIKINPQYHQVELKSGISIDYDILVLATGSLPNKLVGFAGGGAFRKAEMEATFQARINAIQAAKDILIVGGGPSAVELSGEITAEYGSYKKVTLVASDVLIPNNPLFSEKAREKLSQKAKDLGVTVYENAGRVNVSHRDTDRTGMVVGQKNYQWTGGSGDFDLCFFCVGLHTVPALYKDSGLADTWLDAKGFVNVDKETLAVIGTNNTVFGVGDCTNSHFPKLAAVALAMGQSIVKNIILAASGKPLKKLSIFHPPVFIVPLGPKKGVTQIGPFLFGDQVTSMLKGSFLNWKVWPTANAGKAPQIKAKDAITESTF